VDDSLRLHTFIICDYDRFKFREDDSIKNFDILIDDCKGSLLFKYEYDCFNFLEDESFVLGESELVSERHDASFYSCESVSDFSNPIEWSDEEKECEKEIVGNDRSFTFDLMKRIEWIELTTLEIEEGSEEIWFETNEKIFSGGREEKEKEVNTILEELRRVFNAKIHPTLHIAIPLSLWVFKDVSHLGTFLEAKVHGTLGRVPKSVCLEG